MWIKDEYKEIMVEPQLNYIALKCAIHSVPLLQLISLLAHANTTSSDRIS